MISRAEVLLLLLAIPSVLIAVGYPLAGRLRSESPADRIAIALLAGVAALLASIAAVNAVVPIDGFWAWLCVVPWIIPFIHRAQRERFGHDLAALLGRPSTWGVSAAAFAFLIALLWPLFTRPELVFYDGSANHDAFFWITAAEHLKRSTYLMKPVADATHPLLLAATGITGMAPGLGRMGTEGLLALLSALCGGSPLKIFVAASAALFFPWLAAQFMLWRTFFGRAMPHALLVLIPVLQPIFVFFHANANTPNLVGVLVGALAIVAVAKGASVTPERRVWAVLLALAVHGLLCSYPEAVPAVAAPILLLLGREVRDFGWRVLAWPLVAVLAGVVVNPLTTLRAWNGFFCSLHAADSPAVLANIFAKLDTIERLPAAVTLSVPFAHDLQSPWLALAVALLLLGSAAVAIASARDRFGALALTSGIAVIGVYTAWAQFGYGWQKTIQFSAVIVATLVPVAGTTALAASRDGRKWLRVATYGAAVCLLIGFAYATVANIREAHKWSQRKYLTTEWFQAREYGRHALRDVPILVEGRGFEWPFFYTMWASYFLGDSPIIYVGDELTGGYLRAEIALNPPVWSPTPRVRFVPVNHAQLSQVMWHSDHLAFVAVR